MYSFDRDTGLLYVPASLTDSGFTNGLPGNACGSSVRRARTAAA